MLEINPNRSVTFKNVNNLECLKLLLQGKASIQIANEPGETPLDITKRLKHEHCEELLTQALSGRFSSHVHVEYEWRLLHEDLDERDDDMDEKVQPSSNRREDRPISFYQLRANQLHSNAVLQSPAPPAPRPRLPPRNVGKVQTASSTNTLWKTNSVSVDGGSRQRSSSDLPAVHPPLPPLRVTSTNPLTPTPPAPVAKTPSMMEALSQPNKPAPPEVSQSRLPPLPPQPPSRLPQKKPGLGTDESTPLTNKGQPRGPVDLSAAEALGPLSNAVVLQPPAPMPRKS
ncbi:Arf-GAP with SH3 domain, ANK repeat and PH domain-containing protein 2 [Saguinus oedipus]|uniref:Arf-GAP with SH3 domain, ANK repeat and PH domain-containing protein 2 n=1 Tax=Saguinus oedipus TaxID=9490 RepID=A0ABQ9WB35_SAGOE|nr:Arf-GAP with SH3 domain, ANK repeat and PH domain-containing protein 2 [Saguinus oedipus]